MNGLREVLRGSRDERIKRGRVGGKSSSRDGRIKGYIFSLP